MGVCSEERHLTLRVATIAIMRVRLVSSRIARRLTASLGEKKTCLLIELVSVDKVEFYLGALPRAPVASASVAAADKAVL
jgi:hypothetical protein